jgi:hypothetical protein
MVEFSGTARTENFTPVVAPGAPRGQMALVRVSGRTADHLTGEIAATDHMEIADVAAGSTRNKIQDRNGVQLHQKVFSFGKTKDEAPAPEAEPQETSDPPAKHR